MTATPPVAEDIPAALNRFDELGQLEKLLLWLCAYIDEPMDVDMLTRLLEMLVQRLFGKYEGPILIFRKNIKSLQNRGWIDESCRCPSPFVRPLFLKALRSYFQGGKGSLVIQEFDRYLGLFHPVRETDATSEKQPTRGRTQRQPAPNNMLMVLAEIIQHSPAGYGLNGSSASKEGPVRFRRMLRGIQVEMARGNPDEAFKYCATMQYLRLPNVAASDIAFPFAAAFPPDFAEAFFAATSLDNRQIVHAEILRKSFWYPVAEVDRLLAGIQSRCLINAEGNARVIDVHAFSIKLTRLMLMGRLSEARSMEETSGLKWPCHRALASFLQGRLDEGKKAFQSFLKELGYLHTPWIELFGCFLHFLHEILRSESVIEGGRIARTIDKLEPLILQPSNVEKAFLALLKPMIPTPTFQVGSAVKALRETVLYGSPTLELFRLLAILCMAGELLPQEMISLKEIQSGFAQCGDGWLAVESAAMLIQAGADEPAYRVLIDEMRNREGIVPFVWQLPIEASWKKRIRAILQTLRPLHPEAGQKAEAPQLTRRIIWQLYIDSEGHPLEVQAVEQKRGKGNKWSAGRVVGVNRLQSAGFKEFMTDQDRAIAACTCPIEGYRRSRYAEYQIDPDRAVVAMIGHPHVYSYREPGRRIELVRAEPELVARRKNGKILLQIHPPSKGDDVLLVQDENPNRYKVVVFSQLFQRVANLIGEDGIEIPATEKDVVSEALSSLSTVMTVHSAVPFGDDRLEQVPANPVPIVQVSPEGSERFRMNILVRPFGSAGPMLQAGKGTATIVSEIDGKHLQTVRNLAEEKRLAAVIQERLLGIDSADGAGGQWIVEHPEDCLQALADLRELQEQGMAVVEWPEGEKFTFSRPLSFDQMHIRMRSVSDWFEMEGELQIEQDRVIGMKQLIDLLAANPGRRFVQMEDGLFLSLTAALRKRLEELSAFTEKRGKKLLLHGLAAAAVQEVIHPFRHVEAAPQWQDRLKRIEEAMRLEPAIPSTLRAELREYQKEGFRWMVRLAHLGCGACLADDMGLGKTVQTLAVLLEKAAQAPALVIAPMSVCANWIAEAHRFAPTLRVHTLHVPDRKALIDGLGAMDVLVTSYGLLHQEGETLAAKSWGVIVLDEAQAIKNMTTKRYQAAVRLQGNFKLITTGTPVENHLGEFYTLFQFINPGLLGSKDRFNRRFVVPIEKEHDKQAQQRLRKLVKPFILRRLKSQVLEELPPRTDIVLHVELKPEEIALYEAMRQKALERIATMDGPIERRRFELLAEIMKLRQVCCHPKLVYPEFPDVGSKLEVFGEVVSELLEGGHKALVFSQFLGHLALIRNYLHKAGISYRYLDGQTPAKQRQQEIEAFQSGSGDLFLISLKAGGLGLNLTAADYVIHMDPWWNPAVEDQASDRAHRIGQSQPVTVYRLVAQGTIEEKIVKLHAEKRELAESLLEGTDTSARIGADELLRLIQEEEM